MTNRYQEQATKKNTHLIMHFIFNNATQTSVNLIHLEPRIEKLESERKE
jgi:hypothetical protein